MSAGIPRVVVFTRPTEYENLLERHGTYQQARFFLATRQQSIEPMRAEHELCKSAMVRVDQAIPLKWRRTRVLRRDLDRFLFAPDDIVVAVGQDGLVANLAKYLDGQPVIGINPDGGRNDGILCPHDATHADVLLDAVHVGKCDIESRTMVEAATDDGQRLLALNEIFVGQRGHQSARYRIAWRRSRERQSSSGLIVTTGTGSTGWARSVRRQRDTNVTLPAPCEQRLAFFVREAFPSVATGADVTDGEIVTGEAIEITSEMNEGGVIFGDGIESDRIAFHYGMRLSIAIAGVRLNLVAESDRAGRRSRRVRSRKRRDKRRRAGPGLPERDRLATELPVARSLTGSSGQYKPHR